MELKVVQGDIVLANTEVIIVSMFEGVWAPNGTVGSVSAVNTATNGQVSQKIQDSGFTGKELEHLIIHSPNGIQAKYVIIIGLGERDNLSPVVIRKAAAKALQQARSLKAKTVASTIYGSGVGMVEPEVAARSVAEGFLLGGYKFMKYKTKDREKQRQEQINTAVIYELNSDKLPRIVRGITKGSRIAEAVIAIRNTVNEPPTQTKPQTLVEQAQQITAMSSSMKLTVLDAAALKKEGYAALLAVASGSEEPPYLIHLQYLPKKNRSRQSVVFVGKGVTFDSGGLGIKPWAAMRTMKSDMAGAAAVLGIMHAAVLLESIGMPFSISIHGVIPATENMISGKAMRPDDIIETKSGKTIEVAHTDAEGRLILSDALTYAVSLQPSLIIDFATLTGAAIRALGRSFAAVMGNDPYVVEHVKRASIDSGELVWELPLHAPYREYLESSIADMQNIGKSEYAPDAIIGGLFLQEFIDDVAWAHIDIAGPSWTDEDSNPVYPKGATGFGVLLGLSLLEAMQSTR